MSHGEQDESTRMLRRPEEALLKQSSLLGSPVSAPRPPGPDVPPQQTQHPGLVEPQERFQKTQDARQARLRDRIGHRTARILSRSARVQPLDASLFEKVSVEQVSILNELLSLGAPLAAKGSSSMLEILAHTTESLTGLKGLRLDLHGVRVVRNGSDVNGLFERVGHAVRQRFELPPCSEHGILTVDQSLVDPLLGAMLAESTGGVRRAQGLSARDRGLFAYMLLRALDALVEGASFPPFVLALEQPTRAEFEALWKRSSRVVEVVFLASLPNTAGFVRVWLPEILVRNLVRVWPELSSDSWLGALVDPASSQTVGQWRINLSLSLASQRLGQVDVWDLQRGDVLLLAEHGISPEWCEQEGIGVAKGDASRTGGARLLFTPDSYMEAQLVPCPEHGCWGLRVENTRIQRAAGAHSSKSREGTHMAQQESAQQGAHHTSDLLRESQVELEVRFARVQMKVEDLARLSPGQILTLDIPLGEPVELVAGGAVLGQGELVNVEGHLGVRLLSRR